MGLIAGGKWRPFDAAFLTETLQIIVGLPLTDLWRPIWQCFEFGEQKPFINRKGDEAFRADCRVTISCDWTLTVGPLVVFGSGDHSGKRRFYHRITPPKDEKAKVRWQRAKEFFRLVDEQALIVESVSVSESGLIQIALSQGYEIKGMQCNADNSELFDWHNDAAGEFFYVCTDTMSIRSGRGEDD